jgi:hypothetical protein
MSVSGNESLSLTEQLLAVVAHLPTNSKQYDELQKAAKEIQKRGEKKVKKEKERDPETGKVIKKPLSEQLKPWQTFSKDRVLATLKEYDSTVVPKVANRIGKLVADPKRSKPGAKLTQENYDSIEDEEIIDCYNEWKNLPKEAQWPPKKEGKGKKGSSSSSEVEETEEEEEESEAELAPAPIAIPEPVKPTPKKESKPAKEEKKESKPAKEEKKESKPAKEEKKESKPAKEEKKESKPAKEEKKESKPAKSDTEEKAKPKTRPVMSDTEETPLIYKEGQYIKQKINGKEYVTYTNEKELYCYDEDNNYYGKYNKKTKKVDGSVKDPFEVVE